MSHRDTRDSTEVMSRFRHDLRNHAHQLKMAVNFAAAAREPGAAAQWLEHVIREADACAETLEAFRHWPHPEGAPLRVLVVEEARTSGSAMARLLRLEGYAAHWAGSAAKAWEWVARGSYHLLVCDLGLPAGDAGELMSKLHFAHGTYGIAMGVAGAETESADAAKAAGFSRYLEKPVSFDDVLAAVRDLLA